MSPDRQITAQDIDCLKEINKKVKFILKNRSWCRRGWLPSEKMGYNFFTMN